MAEKYQLLGKLRPEEYVALEADIRERGVQVPVEVDEEGNVLDGHHRVEIAKRLGKPYETLVRRFATEREKREHVLIWQRYFLLVRLPRRRRLRYDASLRS